MQALHELMQKKRSVYNIGGHVGDLRNFRNLAAFKEAANMPCDLRISPRENPAVVSCTQQTILCVLFVPTILEWGDPTSMLQPKANFGFIWSTILMGGGSLW